jgi:hypothetical protein
MVFDHQLCSKLCDKNDSIRVKYLFGDGNESYVFRHFDVVSNIDFDRHTKIDELQLGDFMRCSGIVQYDIHADTKRLHVGGEFSFTN